MQQKQHRHQIALWLLLLLLAACCAPASCSAQQHPLHKPWRRLLQQLAHPQQLLLQQQAQQPYNGSAVLATYASSLNGSGASLRQLLPAVSGYVNKSGPAEMLNWSQKPHYAIAREAIFLDWRQRELTNPAPQLYAGQGLTCAAARHPPVPFHHCHVFVNHHYRVAYIRSPKSASTSIMNWLGQCRYNKTRNWNSTTCMNYTWEQYHTPEQIASIWNDYFFFGFIRNPWARAYSLYKDMTGTNHFLQKHGPRCQLEWGSFCRDPFGEFDRAYGAGCSHKAPHYAYWHMMDQYHCMITPTGQWAVDFVGRVEKGNEDWRVVVDEMNRRRLPGVPEVPYTALDHVHKVDLPVPGGGGSSSSSSVSSSRTARSAEQLQPQPQTQQQHVRHHTQPQPQRQLLEEAVQVQPQQQQQQPLPGQSQVARLFRHLWRRIRIGTAAANEDSSEADGEVDDFAGGGVLVAVDAAAAAGSSLGQNPDRDGASGPYSGPNEHCIDAVSQWFACDIDRFGYLPPSTTAEAEAAAAAAAAAPPGAALGGALPAAAAGVAAGGAASATDAQQQLIVQEQV